MRRLLFAFLALYCIASVALSVETNEPNLPAASPAGDNSQNVPTEAVATGSKNISSPGAEVTYIANEGFMIKVGDTKVLIDALFDNGFGIFSVPTQELLDQMTSGRQPFADVNLLLITHPHGDHFNPKLVIKYLRNNVHCQLISHTQTIDQLRNEEGFAQIRNQIHEVGLEPGLREHMTVNGIVIDALCLAHMPRYQDGRNVNEQIRNLAFIVNMSGTTFLHTGDATFENSEAQLNGYPFDKTHVDILFYGYFDRSQVSQKIILQKIRPKDIVIMHVPPAQYGEESQKSREVYPNAILFSKSMERRVLGKEIK